MMLLVKMEDYSSSLPSLCMEDAFQLIDGYSSGLYGRKKKKRHSLDVAECRLDSPCNSPEVIMSSGVEDGTERCPKLLQTDSSTNACDSVDHSNMFGVDMEGFYEISATITADEDIMLSSSAKESTVVLKKVAVRHDLSKVKMEDVHDVSHSGSSASSSSSALESEFEKDVDVLLDNCLSIKKDVRLPALAHDLLPDLSGLAVSGYLLSDIPSHPDLSCEASEPIDALLSYCSDSECLSSCDAVQHSEHNKEDVLSNIKCEENICIKDQHEAVYSDFDALCTNTLLDDMQSNMNDSARGPSCQCPGRECLCYKSEVSSAEEEDACTEYTVSQRPSKVRRAKGKSARMVRRGPGRPRKLHNTDFVRRGPGRPRKKSVSDAVVWYQTRRKRTVSFSNGYKSRDRQTSLSDDKDAQNLTKRACVPDTAGQIVKSRKSCSRGENEMPWSDYQLPFYPQRLPSLQPAETDEEDIVDVVSIGDEFQELYGVSTMAELVQHISAMHNYHTQRFMSCRFSGMEGASTCKSTSKFSINLPMPAKSTSRWSRSIAVLSDGRKRRFTVEQRSKREALNDLERRRRYALARELSALRDVIPDVNEGFRTAKVVILAAAENHIRVLERKLRRDQSILKTERERHLYLKAKLQALSVVSNT